ncbi:unnamed protein product [Cercopithifilaria johnstoni]|uniref:Uncharacterized protein n=1 Tax=Cercopithifilaria johnstoni TaxID=2874296 RepID=A0A8J2LSE3_9BILA|nr:unnamed protein product [Cercopithifilaria johnstoni]
MTCWSCCSYHQLMYITNFLHFLRLRINWDGVPEFQWRTVNEEKEKRLLKIENIVPSDVHNPWLYPVVLSASHMEADFLSLPFNERANFSFGKINLYFPDDNTLAFYTLNYLVYRRTARKVIIVNTVAKSIMKLRKSLKKRLGHLHMPTPGMCQLLIKPIPEEITEKQIRNDVFPHWEITKLEFKHDSLKQQCSILTFPSAQLAIAAHCTTNYVTFEENSDVASILYPTAAVPKWDEGENLLVAAEMGKKDAFSCHKEKCIEEQIKKHITRHVEREQIEAKTKEQKTERKFKERMTTERRLKDVEKCKMQKKQAVRRTHTSTFTEPSNKIPRRGICYHGLSSPSRGSCYPIKTPSWRREDSVRPLHSIRDNFAYNENGLDDAMNEFNYNTLYDYHPECTADGFYSALEQSSWRNDFGSESTPSIKHASCSYIGPRIEQSFIPYHPSENYRGFRNECPCQNQSFNRLLMDEHSSGSPGTDIQQFSFNTGMTASTYGASTFRGLMDSSYRQYFSLSQVRRNGTSNPELKNLSQFANKAFYHSLNHIQLWGRITCLQQIGQA